MSEKKDLLPFVTNDVSFAVQAELNQLNKNEYIANILKRLFEDDNPNIANFLSKFAIKTKDPVAVLYSGILVYRLLESQAEANQMGYQFGEKEK